MLRSLRRFCVAAAALSLAASIGALQISASAPNERQLSLYNIHNGERLTVVYKRDGEYVPEALEKLSWIFRDWRLNKATKMDPAAFDILWEVYTELGSQRPVHIISGFRSAGTNERLRKKGGGQAKHSQHILGKALDVHFPDVSAQKIRYAALVRERGGVGYYPTSALPFVHIDTGRVRMWPRMPRQELALLFPSGKSKYVPADGRPITPGDVAYARTHYAKLAKTIMAFHEFRAKPKDRVLVASLEATPPPAPEPEAVAVPAAAEADADGSGAGDEASPLVLASADPDAPELSGPALIPAKLSAAEPAVAAPKPVPAMAKPKLASLGTMTLASLAPEEIVPPKPRAVPAKVASLFQAKLPVAEQSAADAGETEIAALEAEPALLSKTGWSTAPEYDDEHDDELSYRPFQLGPYLTRYPDIDDPALARLVHPRLAEAHQDIGDDAGDIRLTFKQTEKVAQAMWTGRFADNDVAALMEGREPAKSRRKIKTAQR